jgi:peptide-methionine (S)-S-oxide reductase
MKNIFPITFLLFATLISCAQKKSNASITKEEDNKLELIKTKDTIQMKHLDTITLGAGCFWCVEAVFQQLNGVVSVTSGYAGGHIANPTYEQICTKTTGHAEVCQITWDTTQLGLDELLEVYWQTHDPTTLNQQGADKGPQYRSVIFYHNDNQQQVANYYKQQLNDSKAFNAPIVTAVEAYSNFYKAEEEHQNFYKNNPNQSYCYYVIRPKMEKFYKVFKTKAKPE